MADDAANGESEGRAKASVRTIELVTNGEEEVQALLGPQDVFRRALEERLPVRVAARGGVIRLTGGSAACGAARQALEGLLQAVRSGRALSEQDIGYAVAEVRGERPESLAALAASPLAINARGREIRPHTAGQAQYVRAMQEHDLVFAIGPAGTGKTYLAMAMAVALLRAKKATRVVLTRPVVEAGERLGFLPGDLLEKIDPYLRPLHDALYDLLGAERFQRYSDRKVIEVCPLAYMRGRTLNEAFIVLDEAQNTTPVQMKMFLTRMGEGSQMVVTGDITQTDLPRPEDSGLRHARQVLSGLPGIAFCELGERDIVRHRLVQRIVQAYEAYENQS
jgi:phosphate starvation-inducible PhoH-like protein